MKISDIENDKEYYVVYKKCVYLKSEWGIELKNIFSGEKLIEMLDVDNNYIVLNFLEKRK